MVIVTDEATRLQAVDKVVNALQVPGRCIEAIRLDLPVPKAVEPDGAHLAVIGEQFGELLFHEGDVMLPQGIFFPEFRGQQAVGRGLPGSVGEFTAGVPSGTSQRPVILPGPVQQGIIEMDFQALPVAFVRKFLQDIPLEGGGVNYVEVGSGGIEHRKSVMMAGSDADVPGTCLLEGGHPFRRIEPGGVESPSELFVFIRLQALGLQYPLALPEHGVDAPVDEDTELFGGEFLLCTGVRLFKTFLYFRRGALASGQRKHEGKRHQEKIKFPHA